MVVANPYKSRVSGLEIFKKSKMSKNPRKSRIFGEVLKRGA